MINIILVIIKIVVLLGFLVFIHELGHFTVAKLCHVKVNEFALGFGPVLLSKQGKETKYQLRLIPLGGFVSMEGETEQSNEERAFNKVSIPKRIAIVAAGGLINIIFATILFFGLQVYKGENVSTVIKEVIPGYSAEISGLKPEDEIYKIGGRRVRRSIDVIEAMENNKDREVEVTVKRNGEKIKVKIIPTVYEHKVTGILFSSMDDTVIKGFEGKESIKNQGFKNGDKIISIEGVEVEDDVAKLLEVIEANKDKESLKIEIKRANKEIDLIDTKLINKTEYKLGAAFKEADKTFGNNLYYAALDTIDFDFSIVENLKMLIKGEASTDEMVGPVGISKYVAKKDNLWDFLYFMAIISLSLGFTNLLPFPPLDGGKIVFLLIEGVRKKPVSERIEVGIQMAGFAILIVLSLYVTYNDIFRVV